MSIPFPKVVAHYITELSQDITASATDFYVQNVNDEAGNPLSGLFVFTIDVGTSIIETVLGTITNGHVTGVVRGIDPQTPNTPVISLQNPHSRGASVKITDYTYLQLAKAKLNGEDGIIPIIYYDVPQTFTLPNQIVDKDYVDNAIGGGGSGTVRKTITQTAHGFVAGNIVRNDGTANEYTKSQANNGANAEVVGYVDQVIDANTFVLVVDGYVTGGVPVQTANTRMFLSDSVAGALTTVEPTALNTVSKPLLTIIQSGAVGFFHNQRGKVQNGSSTASTFSAFTLPALIGGAGGSKLAIDTTAKTVANTSGETSILDTPIVIPANTLGTNDAIRFKINLSDFDISLSGGQTCDVRLKYGATTVATFQFDGAGKTLTNLSGFIEGYIVANGATNAQKGAMVWHFGGESNLGGLEDEGDAAVSIGKAMRGTSGTATEDSTTDLNLDVTVDFNVASPSNSITNNFIIVEKISSTVSGSKKVGVGENDDITFFNLQFPWNAEVAATPTVPWTYNTFAPNVSWLSMTGSAGAAYSTLGILKKFAFNSAKTAIAQYVLGYEAGATTDSWHGFVEAGNVPGSGGNAGAYFFNDAAGTGNLFATTNDGATENSIAIPGITLTNRNVWRIEMDPSNTTPQVRFYVNGVLVATSTTNLPFAKTTDVGFGVQGVGAGTNKLDYMSAPSFALAI